MTNAPSNFHKVKNTHLELDFSYKKKAKVRIYRLNSKNIQSENPGLSTKKVFHLNQEIKNLSNQLT